MHRPAVPLAPSLEDALAVVDFVLLYHERVQGELHRRPFGHALLVVVNAPGVLGQDGAARSRRCREGGGAARPRSPAPAGGRGWCG